MVRPQRIEHFFNKLFLILICILALGCRSGEALVLGDERFDQYGPFLEGQRVALLSNHTGLVGGDPDCHILDFLLSKGVDVRCIFSPEHGFRGTGDAGQRISDSVDPQTGLPILSLYSERGEIPSREAMDSFDVLVVDIQDVGLRFYTYYITMMHLMEACALDGKAVIVLDRPNPNGAVVDGPVLADELRSGVGAIPVPVLHGLTLGELALMINGEGWLKGGMRCDLEVVSCLGYTHSMRYPLPVPPSPNLRSELAVALYPSLCFFEGTAVSLGRGTEFPFEVYGHPSMVGGFSFTPQPGPGSKNPPLRGQECHGVDLRGSDIDAVRSRGVDLSYVIDAWTQISSAASEKPASSSPATASDPFFLRGGFFDKLAGQRYVREMILSGASASEIRARWQPEVEEFKTLREKYLLYR